MLDVTIKKFTSKIFIIHYKYSKDAMIRRTTGKITDAPGTPFNIVIEQYSPKFGDGQPEPQEFISSNVKNYITAISYGPTMKLFSLQQNPQQFISYASTVLPKDINLQHLLDWTPQQFIKELSRVLCFGAINYPLRNIEITPWTIEIIKPMIGFDQFLGSTRALIPISIYHDNILMSTQNFTEELVYGALIILERNKKFKLLLKDVVDVYGTNITMLSYGELMDSYDEERVPTRRYTATIKEGKDKVFSTFHTLDVITGVITACKWINEDPHKYISAITDNGIPVTF